jgi:proline iminopeptidase
MPKLLKRIFILPAIAAGVLWLWVILKPRDYPAPVFEPRPRTQYWKMRNGASIGYTVISKRMEKKPYPVIYLHGGPGGHISDGHIQALAPLADSGFRVYLYDQIGSGHSDRLNDIDDYTVQRHLDDLGEIVRKLNAPKVILVGQSWGAVLASLFAAEHPELVHRLVLTSPGPVFPMHSQLADLPVPDSILLKPPVYGNEMGNHMAANWRTKAMKWMAIHTGLKLASDKEADQFASYLSQLVDRSIVCDTSRILPADAGSGYYASIKTFQSLLEISDPRPKLRAVQASVLVMKGQCDNQKWGYTKEYLDLFPRGDLKIIPGAGHAIEVEQPGLYIRSIVDFLTARE